jgi:hypothetical protein
LQELVADSEFRRTHKNLETKFFKVKFADSVAEAHNSQETPLFEAGIELAALKK